MANHNGPAYIPRKLSWKENDSESPKVIRDNEVLHSFAEPIVVLGDPGSGKTELMKILGEQPGCRFFSAKSFLIQNSDSMKGADCLVIDGLDEVATAREGEPLHLVLEKLIQCKTPRFVISCRAAEWDTVTGNLQIAEEYRSAPKVVHLEPLLRTDAIEYLHHYVNPEKSSEIVHQLDEYNLTEFYQNPLNLKLIAAIVASEGDLPRSRVSLYERAVIELRKEENPHHKPKSQLTRLSEDEALCAAGTVMAAMLITGNDAASITTESEALKISELFDIANIDHVQTILKSRLFRTDSARQDCFSYLHRSIAEFLGARWLAKKIDSTDHQSRTAKRFIGLISSAGGIPSSLRGLHAWLPKFSPMLLGPLAIEKDPYGILLYGDGDNLSAQQARQMIKNLKDLSRFDPTFRTDWWKTISLKGLAHRELIEEIRAIIGDTSTPLHFRSLILESIAGSTIITNLESTLRNLMLDRKRYFHERREAAQALSPCQNCTVDWGAIYIQLVLNSDMDSIRIGLELLSEIGFYKISTDVVAEFVVTYSGIRSTGDEDDRVIDGVLYYLSKQLPDDRTESALNEIVKKISPIFKGADIEVKASSQGWQDLSKFMEHLILRRLICGKEEVTPSTLWSWLRYLTHDSYHSQDDREAITAIFRSDDRLRQGVQRNVLFDKESQKQFHVREMKLYLASHGLTLTSEDAEIFLQEVTQRCDMSEQAHWQELVNRFRDNGRIPKHIQEIARPFAKNNHELLEFLTKKIKQPKPSDLSVSNKRYAKRRVRERSVRFHEARKNYTDNLAAVKNGDIGWISNPAKAYLGIFSDLDRKMTPHERIADWLGDELADAAREGFEATLHRTEVPTAEQISENYAESRRWHYVYPMLSGAAERIRTGKGLSDLSYNLLSALSIATDEELIPQRETFPDLKFELENLLRRNPDSYELHLRTKFEPKLRKNWTEISGLHDFTSSNTYQPLSAILSIDWLNSYSAMPCKIEKKLAFCALNSAETGRQLIRSKLAVIAQNRVKDLSSDRDRQLYWLALLFLLNFDSISDQLPEEAEEIKKWFWELVAFIPSINQQHNLSLSISVAQLKWVVSKFRYIWPFTPMPVSSFGGNKPWDATNQIKLVIQLIASEPSEEAAMALADLRAMHDDDYTEIIQSAIAAQHRLYLEARFSPPTLSQLKATLSNSPPQSANDIQAIMVDEIKKLQAKLNGHPLNIVNNFYSHNGNPKSENDCRDQMLIAMGDLPFGIQMPPEVAMPQGNRSDAAFVYGQIAVPFEAKGQWHKEVWSAASTQLDKLYCSDYKSGTKGIYVVFWFGREVTQKKPKTPPKGTKMPTTALEMQAALVTLIPIERRDDIAVVVLDLTRSKEIGQKST